MTATCTLPLPTVVVGNNDEAARAQLAGGTRSALDLVKDTSFGVTGPASAPRLWMFVDPLCSYSVKALQEIQPFVAASLQPPNCALGDTLPIKGVATGNTAEKQPAPPSVLGEATTPKQTAGPMAGLLSETPDIDQVPVLKHISETGAKIFDLGTSHGLRGVLARLGEEFMLLEVAPDGQAVVAGLQSELSVSALLSIAGHGLRGIFVRDGAAFQVFYATPDGDRLIPGVMWDAAGKNVTREQVAPITDIVPPGHISCISLYLI
jgi:hypothetical protein